MKRAAEDEVPGQEGARARGTEDDFTFVVLADSQLGMLRENDGWEEEADMLRAAVRHVNRLKPAFVVICGDLVHAFPEAADLQEKQVLDFKQICAGIDDKIALVCVCGNHDVGNRPTQASVESFRGRFGADYRAFWVRGVRFIVLNTQLHKDSAGAPDLAVEQDAWLESEMEPKKNEGGQNAGIPRTVAFSHIPPFVSDPDEPDGYFNLSRERRMRLLATLRRGGCTHLFCGHYHRNAGGIYHGAEGPLEASFHFCASPVYPP